jgi:condensin-2 complex subunit G2
LVYSSKVVLIEHASDTRSASVRAASVEAAIVLLGPKQSHGVLRPLLPSLGNLIHDKSEKVRLATVKLLNRVKQIPGIRFYHVVPVDQLTARFVEEAKNGNRRSSVSKELTSLMLNSYFPQGPNVSAGDQLKRSLTFLVTDPNAASVFYANLTDHLETGSAVQFILLLLTCLKSAVDVDQAYQVRQSKNTKKRRRRRNSTHSYLVGEDDEDLSESLSADNTALMASLADIIDALWGSIDAKLQNPKYHPVKKTLQERSVGKDIDIVGIISHFERKGYENSSRHEDEASSRIDCFSTCSSLLSCAARLDKKYAGQVVTSVESSLKIICKEDEEAFVPLVSSYLSFMCSFGYVNEVASSLSTSIESSLGDYDVTLLSPENDGLRRSRRRSSRLTCNFGPIPTLCHTVAWGVLDGVLQALNSKYRHIRETIFGSDFATSAIEKALEKGIKFANGILGCSDDSFGRNFAIDEVESVIHAFEAYGRFALHKVSSDSFKKEDEVSVNRQLSMLLRWTSDKIVPVLIGSDKGASILRDLDVSHISSISESLIHEPPGSPSLSSPPKQKLNRGRTPEAMRGSSSIFDVSQNDPPIIFVQNFASSLLFTSCMISSELLAMGVTSADDIAEAAVGWCKVFDTVENSTQSLLFSSFVRLAVQLNRTFDDCTLLGRLLVSWSNDHLDEVAQDAMKKLLMSIVRNRGGVKTIVSTFFSVAEHIVHDKHASLFQAATCISDIWNESDAIHTLLEVVTENKQAQIELAKGLVTRLSMSKGTVTPVTTFYARCLSYVSTIVNRSLMLRILNDVDSERFHDEVEMRLLFEKLLEGLA